ncbi:MAG TPA: hypothetical protein VGY31_08715 [Terriglobia bacterium]|nr:hypothetical protein [Terriglobia bacterium]
MKMTMNMTGANRSKHGSVTNVTSNWQRVHSAGCAADLRVGDGLSDWMGWERLIESRIR